MSRPGHGRLVSEKENTQGFTKEKEFTVEIRTPLRGFPLSERAINKGPQRVLIIQNQSNAGKSIEAKRTKNRYMQTTEAYR